MSAPACLGTLQRLVFVSMDGRDWSGAGRPSVSLPLAAVYMRPSAGASLSTRALQIHSRAPRLGLGLVSSLQLTQ